MPGYKDLRKNKKYGKTALAYAVEKVYSDSMHVLQKRMSQEELNAFFVKMEKYKDGEKEITLDETVKSRLGGLEKFHQIMENSADDKLGIELMEIMKNHIKAERDERAKNNDPFLPIYDYYLQETTTEGNIMEARFESQYLAHLNQFSGMPHPTDDNNEMKKNLQQEKDEVTGKPTGLYEPLMDFYKGYTELEQMELVRQKNNREGWNAEKERAFLAELKKRQQNVVDAFDKLYAIEDNHQYDEFLCNDLGHITGKYDNRRSSYEAVNVLRWQIKAIENGWSQDELSLLGAIGYIEAYHKSNEIEFNKKMANYHTRVEKHKDDWTKLPRMEMGNFAEAQKAVFDEQSNRLRIERFTQDIANLKEQIFDKKVSSPEDKAEIIKLVDQFVKSHVDVKIDNFISEDYLSKPVKYNLDFVEEVKKLNPKRRKYKLYDDVKAEAPKEEAIKLEDEKIIEDNKEQAGHDEKAEDKKVVIDNEQPKDQKEDEHDVHADAAVNVQDDNAEEKNPENYDKIRKAFNIQKRADERYMYLLMYTARNNYIGRIDELHEIRPIDDSANIENRLFYYMLNRFEGRAFNEKKVERLYEKLMLAQVKAMVLTGKNFKAIEDSIEGEYKYDKALLVASVAGVFDLADTESNVRQDILHNDIFKSVFKNMLKFDPEITPDMTYEQAYNNLGFTKEEQDWLAQLVDDPQILNKRILDTLALTDRKNVSNNELKQNVYEILYRDYINVHKQRGVKKVLASLSAEEKKYYDIGSLAYGTAMHEKLEIENAKDKEAVRWSKEEAADKIKAVSLYFLKDQLNTMNAFLYGEKPIGISKKNEMNGAYRDMLNKNTDYIGAILKGDPEAVAKADAEVGDTKLHKQLGSSNKKLAVSFDSYIKLHSGIGMGKNPDEMVDNLAKCMAAKLFHSKGSKFDLDKIHNIAERCKEIYSLEALKDNPEQLIGMLRNTESLNNGINSLRDTIYKVAPDKQDKYFDDMKKLADNLPTTTGHGKQYSKLNGLIKEAAALKDKNLPNAKRDIEIRNINIRIYNAAVQYFESKGIKTLDVEKNPRAVAALNAISVLTSSTEGLKYRTTKLVVDLNRSLDKRHDAAAGNFENIEAFTKKYGSQNIDMQKDKIKALAAKNKNVIAGKNNI